MRRERDLKSIPDDELLRRLTELLGQSRRVEADLVAHIAEVDARRLYARAAASSMFTYCTEILHLSEQEAYLRIAVARASREHPMLLTMLREGRLHLSGIARLAPHLTQESRQGILARAAHMSHRQIMELVAELEPQPDAPATIRKLPSRPGGIRPGSASPLGPDRAESPARELCPDRSVHCDHELRLDGRTGPDAEPRSEREPGPAGELCAHRVEESDPALCPDGFDASSRSAPTRPARPPRVAPLAPSRYKVQFTASAELRHKLERLQALMRSSVPDGDLATLIEAAVTEKLERLEARRFARTKKPRKGLAGAETRPSTRHIPAPIRRAVYERDGGRCTYTDAGGRRCTARHRLEFHHDEPFGRGGDHSLKNLRLMCRTHNALLAELDYGKEVVARCRRSPDRVSEPAVAYGAVRRLPGGPLLHSP